MDLVKLRPKINPRLKTFLRPLSKEEFASLEKKCIKDGIRDPIVIWNATQEAVDGHHRLEIAEKHNLKFKMCFMDFETIEDVEDWIADHHVGRRNLSATESAYLLGREYRRKVGDKGGAQDGERKNVAEELAAKNEVSKGTVLNSSKFADAVDRISSFNPEAKEALLAGETSKGDVVKFAKLPDATVKIIADKLASGTPLETIKDRVPQPIVDAMAEIKKRSPMYDDKIISNLIGRLVRSFLDRAKVYGKSAEYIACEKAMESVQEAWDAWSKLKK